MAGSEIVAGVVLLLGGGFAGKVLNAWAQRNKSQEVRHKLDAEVASEIRDELRGELAQVRAEVNAMREDIRVWQEKYYLIRHEYLLTRADLKDALGQLEQFGVKVVMRPISPQLLEDLHLKYEEGYEEGQQ